MCVGAAVPVPRAERLATQIERGGEPGGWPPGRVTGGSRCETPGTAGGAPLQPRSVTPRPVIRAPNQPGPARDAKAGLVQAPGYEIRPRTCCVVGHLGVGGRPCGGRSTRCRGLSRAVGLGHDAVRQLVERLYAARCLSPRRCWRHCLRTGTTPTRLPSILLAARTATRRSACRTSARSCTATIRICTRARSRGCAWVAEPMVTDHRGWSGRSGAVLTDMACPACDTRHRWNLLTGDRRHGVPHMDGEIPTGGQASGLMPREWSRRTMTSGSCVGSTLM